MWSFFVVSLSTIIGACLGSFATMLIHRLHYDEPGILKGRSHCPNCKTKLQAQNLVPIFSWLFQKGQCAYCQKSISYFYPLIETVFALCFFLFSLKYGASGNLWIILSIVFVALVLFFYDLRFFQVDERIIFPALILLFVYAFFQDSHWSEYLIGGLVGGGFYAFQYYISGGKWVGFGDIYLGIFMGLVLGWLLLLMALLFAYILGSGIAIPLLLMKKVTGKTQVPMGAFLMPAFLVCFYFGNSILNTYMRLASFSVF